MSNDNVYLATRRRRVNNIFQRRPSKSYYIIHSPDGATYVTNDSQDFLSYPTRSPDCAPHQTPVPIKSAPTATPTASPSFLPTDCAHDPVVSKQPSSNHVRTLAPTLSSVQPKSPNPTFTREPSTSPSTSPVQNPTYLPTTTLEPTTTPDKESRTSIYPSLAPSDSPAPFVTLEPSPSPTFNKNPRTSTYPSFAPTDSLSPFVTLEPSPRPSQSVLPTLSSAPNLSLPPSQNPSLSVFPTETSAPTLYVPPSPSPSASDGDMTLDTNAPTNVASPTMFMVPFSPYKLTIGLDLERRLQSRVLTLNDTILDALSDELDIVLEDYMVQELKEAFRLNDPSLVGVSITVSAIDQRRVLRDNEFGWDRHLQNFQIASFNVNGSSIFHTTNYTNATSDPLMAWDVDTTIDSLLQDSNEAYRVEFMKNHPDADLLRHVVAINGRTVAPAAIKDESTNEKPGGVSIAFGLILVAVALLGLSFYALVYWKKRKERRGKIRRDVSTQDQSSNCSPSPPMTIMTPNLTSSSSPNSNSVYINSSPSTIPSNQEFFFEVSEEDLFESEINAVASQDYKAWETKPYSSEGRPDSDAVEQNRSPFSKGRTDLDQVEQNRSPTVSQARTGFDQVEETRNTPQPIAAPNLLLVARHGREPEQMSTFDGSIPVIDSAHEERAKLYAPPPQEPVTGGDGSFIMGGHKNFRDLAPVESNDGFYSSDWSEDISAIVPSTESDEAKVSSPPKLSQPSSPGPFFSLLSSSSEQSTDDGPPEIPEIPSWWGLGGSSKRKSVSRTTRARATDRLVFRNFSEGRQSQSSMVTPKTKNGGSETRQIKEPTLTEDIKDNEATDDLESMPTDEMVREVQSVSRFLARYENAQDRRKRKVQVHGAGVDKIDDDPGTKPRLQSGAVQKLDRKMHRNQATQTGVEVELCDEDSESDVFGTDISLDSRIGIDPLKGRGFTAGYLISQLKRSELFNLKELFERNEAPCGRVRSSKKESGFSLLSLRRGKNVGDQEQEKDACESPARGGEVYEYVSTSATAATPKHKNTSFRGTSSDIELEYSSCSSESSHGGSRIDIAT